MTFCQEGVCEHISVTIEGSGKSLQRHSVRDRPDADDKLRKLDLMLLRASRIMDRNGYLELASDLFFGFKGAAFDNLSLSHLTVFQPKHALL